jgi:hypothetical protein
MLKSPKSSNANSSAAKSPNTESPKKKSPKSKSPASAARTAAIKYEASQKLARKLTRENAKVEAAKNRNVKIAQADVNYPLQHSN